MLPSVPARSPLLRTLRRGQDAVALWAGLRFHSPVSLTEPGEDQGGSPGAETRCFLAPDLRLNFLHPKPPWKGHLHIPGSSVSDIPSTGTENQHSPQGPEAIPPGSVFNLSSSSQEQVTQKEH